MPKIQVVVSQVPDNRNQLFEINYIGYDKAKAIEIFHRERKHSYGFCGAIETDNDTIIDLGNGEPNAK